MSNITKTIVNLEKYGNIKVEGHMKNIEIPNKYYNELKNELRMFNMLEIMKLELNTMDILLLNEILIEYEKLERLENGFRIFSYDSFIKKYASNININNCSKSKTRLENKGMLRSKRVNGKLALKLDKKSINKIIW